MRLGRRAALGVSTAWAATGGASVAQVIASASASGGRFEPEAFATVGMFGLDWLLDPRFTRMLDHIAASPGAIRGVRAFGILSLGRDRVVPTVAEGVWEDPAGPMDFSRSLAALDALVSRGLVPVLSLGFFPRAISPGPTRPPPSWSGWQALVRGLLDACVRRFGAGEVARWWFEVWNEPNMAPFWTGNFDQYLQMYRATAEAVAESGHAIRLGGPTLAYVHGEGPALMERFLAMLAEHPELRCDFVSFHRKGGWLDEERKPDVGRLIGAAEAVAEAVLRIVPGRARGLAIINDEADMLVGSERPYAARMTAEFPAWLATVAIAYDALSVRYAAHGLRFLAASDNANQHLAQAPFDGRRTLMTPATAPQDLLKLPIYGFYEMLRLMEGQRGDTPPGLPRGVAHLLTRSEHGIAALLTRCAKGGTLSLDYAVRDVDWPRVNVVTFCIDADHTNPQRLWPDLAAARHGQELGTLRDLRSGVPVQDATVRERLDLAGFATVLVWITPFDQTVPEAPRGLRAWREGDRVVLRWAPPREPGFYAFEVTRDGSRISPMPLRAALWTDAAAQAGPVEYAVTALTASGQRSEPALVQV